MFHILSCSNTWQRLPAAGHCGCAGSRLVGRLQ